MVLKDLWLENRYNNFHPNNPSTIPTYFQTYRRDLIHGDRSDKFGLSVAVFEDNLVVGSPEHDKNGAAYLFQRASGNNWHFSKKLLASDGTANDYFGSGVAISHDYMIIGASRDGSNTNGSGYTVTRW